MQRRLCKQPGVPPMQAHSYAHGAQRNKGGGFTSDTFLLLPVLQEEAVRREEPVQAQSHQKLPQTRHQDGKVSHLFLPRWLRWVTRNALLCVSKPVPPCPIPLQTRGKWSKLKISVGKRTIR